MLVFLLNKVLKHVHGSMDEEMDQFPLFKSIHIDLDRGAIPNLTHLLPFLRRKFEVDPFDGKNPANHLGCIKPCQ